MTGMERNSDVVVMSSYAPLFVNVNDRKWSPDLIDFDSSRAYGLPSYYVQKMFSQNRSDVVLPIDVKSQLQPLEKRHGGVGLGTWATQAEYKDIKVTKDGQTLFADDFSKGIGGWKIIRGQWKVEDGAIRQTSGDTDCFITVGDPSWSEYTLSVKARQTGRERRFLRGF